MPETKDGAAALFAEAFFFVTNRPDAPAVAVEYYLNRGETVRRFGELARAGGHRGFAPAIGRADAALFASRMVMAAFEPTFRHAEMAKNEAWAQFLALAHNTLVDLRAKVDGGEDLKPRPKLKALKGEGGWSVLATTFTLARVKPSLVRFRAFALKLASAALEHARSQWLRLAPQHLKPAWATTLIAG